MAKTLNDIYAGVIKNDPARRKNDFYPTPPIATFVLQKYIDLPKNIVEPCAGRGNISVELMRHGFHVHSFDLNSYPDSLCQITTGQDVLSLTKPFGAEALITNPPYHKDLPRIIAEKGISEYDLTALFVRLTFLEGKARGKLFTKHSPSDIIFLSDRLRFDSELLEPINKKDQLGGMIAYMWIVWDKRNKSNDNKTRLRWVTLEDEYDEWKQNYDKCSNTCGR